MDAVSHTPSGCFLGWEGLLELAQRHLVDRISTARPTEEPSNPPPSPSPPPTSHPSWGKALEDPSSGLPAQKVPGPPPEGQAIGRRVSDRSVTVWGEKAGNNLPLSPTAKGSLH